MLERRCCRCHLHRRHIEEVCPEKLEDILSQPRQADPPNRHLQKVVVLKWPERATKRLSVSYLYLK